MAKKSHQRRVEQLRRERQAARQAARDKQKRQLTIVVSAVAVLAVVAIGFTVATTLGDDEPADAANTPSLPSQPTPSVDPAANKPKSIPTAIKTPPRRPQPFPEQVSCSYKKAGPAAKKVDPPANGKVSARGSVPVTLKTSAGDLKLTLNRAMAPCAVNSFEHLTKAKYFDNTKCHRLTVGAGLQVLQCGDPQGTGTGGPGYSFADEVFPQLKYGRGTLAMANSGKDTNGSQFFVVYGDGTGLQPNYSAFGTVDAASLATIDKVANAGVTPANGPGDGPPNTPVQIKSAS